MFLSIDKIFVLGLLKNRKINRRKIQQSFYSNDDKKIWCYLKVSVANKVTMDLIVLL